MPLPQPNTFVSFSIKIVSAFVTEALLRSSSVDRPCVNHLGSLKGTLLPLVMKLFRYVSYSVRTGSPSSFLTVAISDWTLQLHIALSIQRWIDRLFLETTTFGAGWIQSGVRPKNDGFHQKWALEKKLEQEMDAKTRGRKLKG